MISSGKTAGSHLNQLMSSIGFSNQLGNVVGASLDAAIGNNIGLARNLFDAFSPLSSSRSFERMMSDGFCAAGFVPRPHVNFAHHFAKHRLTHYEREQISTYKAPMEFASRLMGDPSLRATIEARIGGRILFDRMSDGLISVARMLPHPCIPFAGMVNQNVTTMLNRCADALNQRLILQNLSNSLRSAMPGFDPSTILNTPNLSFDQQLSQIVQGFIGKLQQDFTKKLEGMIQGGAIQGPKRKKKKKGIGGKLKKGLKGIKKGVKKFGKVAKGLGKGLMKGVLRTVTGAFLKGGFLKGLLAGKLGMIFQLRTGLLGGILGGPVGSALIGQLAKGKLKPKELLKAANPLNQIKTMMNPKQMVSMQLHQTFGQVTAMFQITNAVTKGISDVQRQALTQLLRG